MEYFYNTIVPLFLFVTVPLQVLLFVFIISDGCIKHTLIAGAVILACVYVASVNAWDLSTQATLGRCSTSGYMQTCEENRNVWRVSGQARHALTDRINLAADLIHFSSWDGMDDLRGNIENQSGAVDFGWPIR